MLVIGAVVGYAMHSAGGGAQCSSAYATNETRATMLAGVLNTLHVDHPEALAAQLDAWLEYEHSVPPGGALVVGASSVAAAPAAPSSWFFAASPDMAPCGDGLFLPGPQPSPANITFYLCLLLWSFVGVAIGADVFMVAIEMITSQETTVTRVVNGQYKEFTVLVWNGTIANLTLMALGSSAPEILLSVIEISTSGFYGVCRRPRHTAPTLCYPHARPQLPRETC